MTVREFRAYVESSGVDFDKLDDDKKGEWRERFDRASAAGATGVKDARLEEFLKELRSAKVEGNKIELKSGWMFLDSPILFVRDHYAKFYEDQLNGLQLGGEYSKIVVSGTPGIGKSAFGLYCLYRAVNEGKTVVYCKADADPRVFGPGGATEYNQLPLHYKRDSSVIFIFDGMRPFETAGFALLVTSPNRKVWWEFAKQPGARVLWFPMYSLEEMETLRELAFKKKVSATVMQNRIALFGCNPRHVLEKANVPRYDQSMLEAPIKAFAADAIKSLNLRETGKGDWSHMVVHINTENQNYDDCQLSFASKYVADKVIAALAAKSHEDLMHFYNSTSEISAAGAIRGDIRARFVLDALKKGGTFEVRSLMDDPSGEKEAAMTQVTIDPVTEQPMSKVAPIKDVVFHSASYPGYDMYIPLPESKLINATINLQHEPIIAKMKGKAVGIEVTFKKCAPTNKKVPYLWAVPDEVYNKFQAKSIKHEGIEKQSNFNVGGRYLWQYAMKVPARQMSTWSRQALRLLLR